MRRPRRPFPDPGSEGARLPSWPGAARSGQRPNRFTHPSPKLRQRPCTGGVHRFPDGLAFDQPRAPISAGELRLYARSGVQGAKPRARRLVSASWRSPNPAFSRVSHGRSAFNPEARPEFCPSYRSGGRVLTDATGESGNPRFRQRFRGLPACRPVPNGESGMRSARSTRRASWVQGG
jgi:hypothetical protein